MNESHIKNSENL